MTPKEYISLVRNYAPDLPHQELLDYLTVAKTTKNFNGELYPHDANEDFRNETCTELYKTFSQQDRLFIKFILREMTKSRSCCYGGAVIVLAAFMLFSLGNVEDVISVYNAKFRGNMDSAIAIDQQLLFGAGIENTISYLQNLNTQEAKIVLDYIEQRFIPHHTWPMDDYKRSVEEYFQDLLNPDWQYDPNNPPLY